MSRVFRVQGLGFRVQQLIHRVDAVWAGARVYGLRLLRV